MLDFRQLTSDDLRFALGLSTEAGWNQTEQDWRRFLTLEPSGGWLAEWQGEPAGTVLVCGFGDVAWISMMLVRASLRGLGIGRGLMEQALRTTRQQGARRVRLDATPLGQPLYEKLGFRGEFALTRFSGKVVAEAGTPDGSGVSDGSSIVRKLEPADLHRITELDQRAHGTDRRRLLSALLAERTGYGIFKGGVLNGFCLTRSGRLAIQIGPCLALPELGACLLESVLQMHTGMQVIVDLPDDLVAARRIASRWGLMPQRSLLRMTFGEPPAQQRELLWSSSGGEKG